MTRCLDAFLTRRQCQLRLQKSPISCRSLTPGSLQRPPPSRDQSRLWSASQAQRGDSDGSLRHLPLRRRPLSSLPQRKPHRTTSRRSSTVSSTSTTTTRSSNSSITSERRVVIRPRPSLTRTLTSLRSHLLCLRLSHRTPLTLIERGTTSTIARSTTSQPSLQSSRSLPARPCLPRPGKRTITSATAARLPARLRRAVPDHAPCQERALWTRQRRRHTRATLPSRVQREGRRQGSQSRWRRTSRRRRARVAALHPWRLLAQARSLA